MSYNDQYNEGGNRQGYSGGNDTYGGNQGGNQGGYGEERRHGGNDNYGGNQGGYGGEERRHGGNQDDNYGGGQERRQGNQGGNYGVTGGPEYNTGGGAGYGNQSGGGYNNNNSLNQSGGYPSGPQGHQNQGDNEFGGALQHAQQQSGDSETSLFSTALGFLSNKKEDISSSAPDFDESQATHAHEAVYGKGDNQQHDSQTLGMSAAIQAMQKFTGGGPPQQPPPQKEEGGLGGLIGGLMGKEKHEEPPPQPAGLGGMISSVMGGNQGSQQGQNQFIGLAMKEAAELFNKQEAQGNVVSTPDGENAPGTDKQSVVNSAAEMAMKYYMKQQMASSGGIGALASKFISALDSYVKCHIYSQDSYQAPLLPDSIIYYSFAYFLAGILNDSVGAGKYIYADESNQRGAFPDPTH
ncbi:hypothetical protein MMC30_000094 [Trapelia coarctata]|nr:hypothetical protein [Trapelia coarctata]